MAVGRRATGKVESAPPKPKSSVVIREIRSFPVLAQSSKGAEDDGIQVPVKDPIRVHPSTSYFMRL